MFDKDQEVLARALLDKYTSPEVENETMESSGGGSQVGSPEGEKVTEETKEAVRRMMSEALFIDCSEEEAADGRAPVMIVQHSPYNIYSVLKAYLRPEYVYGVEKFWGLVRQDGAVPRKTWRPRLQSAQIKSLQNTRYPKTEEEWNRVMEMALKTEKYFQAGLTSSDFFSDLRTFIFGFESLWAKERKHILSQSKKKRAKPDEESDDEDSLEPEDSEPEMRPRLKVMRKQNTGSDDEVLGDLDKGTNGATATKRNANKGPAKKKVAQAASACPSLVQQSIDRPKPSRMTIYLFVGGQEFATTRATLGSVPNSFFSRLGKLGPEENPDQMCDQYFIDRSPEMFSYILEYLRARRYGESCGKALPAERKALEHLLREAVFYELEEYADTIRQSLGLVIAPLMDFVVVTSEAVEQPQLEQTILLMTRQCNQLVQDKILRSNGILAVVDQKLDTFVTQYGHTRVQIVVSLRSG